MTILYENRIMRICHLHCFLDRAVAEPTSTLEMQLPCMAMATPAERKRKTAPP